MTNQATPNRLYFGDCLDIMEEFLPDESVDLIYLDPPFNSKRIYNAFIGGAQWVAFDDTWRWYEAIDDFHTVASDVSLAPTMEGLRRILGEGGELAYLSYMANRLRECRRVLKLSGSIYVHCDPTMSHYLKIIMDGIFGKKSFRNEIIWHYRKWSTGKYAFQRNHDVLLFYSRSDSRKRAFNQLYMPRTASTLKRFGTKRIVSGYDETGRRLPSQLAEEDSEGVRQDDVWDIARVPPIKQLYPTEKPLALLERVIKASSNPDDMVLDPFCGCGTTIHAAQNLGRRWIGIDVCVQACKVIQKRIEGHFDSLWDEIEFVGMPKTLEDAKALAAYDPFKFERWAASLVPGMEANKKQRGDKGIDGRGRLPISKGVFVDVVSQVKAGSTNPSHVQAFNEARRQARAELGVFICFEDKVTGGMRNAAVNANKYLDKWPVIQIYTIEDYFAGRLPNLPMADIALP
ncbi:MAG: DNA methyltransferase [Chloroflexi bacterium]|nr:DNA methyltransferase [Chloroflexota bacterium]